MSGQEERKKYRRAAESSSARSPLYRRASRILNSQHLEIFPHFPCNVEIPPLALFLDNLRVEIFRNQYMRPLLRIFTFRNPSSLTHCLSIPTAWVFFSTQVNLDGKHDNPDTVATDLTPSFKKRNREGPKHFRF